MKIELSQRDMVNLMIDHIKECGKHNSGTYNKGDPTHYEKGEARLEIMYGYSLPKSFAIEGCNHTTQELPCDNCKGMDPGQNCPDPELITASFCDCTWGVEFKFYTSQGVLEGYYDNQDKKWMRVKKQKLFKRVFKDALWAPPEGTQFGEECARQMGSGIV